MKIRMNHGAFSIIAFAVTLTVLLGVGEARAVTVSWVGGANLNYDWPFGNWASGPPPDFQFNEEALIGNGNAVFLNSSTDEPAGLLVLSDSSLEIQSGGVLNVRPGNGIGPQPPGDIQLGDAAGLILQSGGTLQALFGEAELAGTTHVMGPSVTFEVSTLNLTDSHTLVAGITNSSTHSALSVSGVARLGGILETEFSSFTPSLGNSWTIVDAGSVIGSFATNATSASLPLGENIFVSTISGGNGQLVRATYDNQLVLAIEANTGTTAIRNLSAGTSEVINGYSITAASGGLDPDGWTSFQDDSQAGWEEANPSGLHLSEQNLGGSRSIGPGSISMGAALLPASQFGIKPQIEFEYNLAGVGARKGAVSITAYTLVLQVDPITGESQIVNPSGFDVEMDAYSILSASGSLDQIGWTPLADSDADWDESNPSSGHLTELNLTGSRQLMMLESGSPLTLGAPFTGGDKDLKFVFNLAPDLAPGDFDTDGDVDGGDFLRWQRGQTPESGSAQELADWQNNYGSTGGIIGGDFTGEVEYVSLGGSVAASTQQVPEPASCLLLVCAGVLVLGIRPRQA